MPELPPPVDQFDDWATEPRIPQHWPGLGSDRRSDGFEIDRRGVKAVGGKLAGLAFGVIPYANLGVGPARAMDVAWALPRDLGPLLSAADDAVSKVWKDLHAEVGMAGLLLERASTRYDLADDPRFGDIPIARLDERMNEISSFPLHSRAFDGPSDLYPNGSVSLHLPEAVYYGVDNMTADQARRDMNSIVGGAPAWYYDEMAGALAELAKSLESRARDLRDAPWSGEAADKAQTALRQIYGNATALAAVAGNMYTVSARFAEIIDWTRANFETVVDPDRGAFNEFWGFDGTADTRARSFLARANDEFLDVYRMMPKRIEENLPGLLVTDENLTELRKQVPYVEITPRWQTEGGWLEKQSTVRAYEKAEKAYG
ncbi:hypothetical protein ACIBQX_17730 [Nonomuraea sp. NPDC049714]|uniref:hypothetical protein n=1 Tax=Nonomuraea sp. NPDC049714 TaxID=3364357 RepID=UPI0037A1C7A8